VGSGSERKAIITELTKAKEGILGKVGTVIS
jgi:carbamate kinase